MTDDRLSWRPVDVALAAALAALLGCIGTASGCGSVPPVDHSTLGRRLAEQAESAWRLGRYTTAANRLAEAVRHLRAADDLPAVASALHDRGVILTVAGDCGSAQLDLAESAVLHRRQGRRRELALNLLAMARCDVDTGDPAISRRHLDEAGALGAALNDGAIEARALAGRAALQAAAGDTRGARASCAAAAKHAKAARDPGSSAQVAHNIARLDAREGHHGAAARGFLAAAASYGEAGDHEGLASALGAAAVSLTASGEVDALRLAELYQRAGHAAIAALRPQWAAQHFAAAASAYDRAGQPGLAEQCRQRGRVALQRAPDP